MNLNRPSARVLLSSLLAVGLATPAMGQSTARPSAPARLAAAAGSEGTVTLNWLDRSSNEVGFRITRQPAFSDGDQVVAAGQTSFADHPGVGRFTYRVAAFNSAGRSSYTSAARVTVTEGGSGTTAAGVTDARRTTVNPNQGSHHYGLPAAPSDLAAIPGLNQVVLSWDDNSNNEIWFEIQKQTQVGQTWQDSPGLQAWIDNTTITDSVSPGTFRYRIRAAQYAGYSAFTSWVTATVIDPAAPPAPPSNLAVVDAGSGRAMLSWTDNSENETAFKLERNPAFAAGVITLNANVTSYLDACGNGSFSYRVRSTNAGGTSTPTAWVGVNVTSGSTGSPTGACCSTTGSCSVLTQAACVASGGTYNGDNVTCAAVNCQPPPPSSGWSNLSAPSGALVVYVAANGSDSNPGTQAAPFRSLQRGYGALRDGQPDQVLLRCGDTWNESGQFSITKGCNVADQYQVIGSYGTGPRPKLNFPLTGFRGESMGKRRVAITGLEIAGTNTADTSAIIMLSWNDVLIEDCMVRGFRDNIVIQDAASNGSVRVTGLKIRRNVIVDAWFTGAPATGRSQGFYIGGCDGWLIEGNVLDQCGIVGSIFSHNGYVHETCGPGDFVGNITARSPSEGVQQRPGGRMNNNLSLANSYGLYLGSGGEVKYNVVLDSKDINSVDRRGTGLLIDGNATVIGNVVAHNQGGTGLGSVKGMAFRGFSGTVSGNIVYDWPNPADPESHCYHFEGGSGQVVFQGNSGIQPTQGILVELLNRPTSGFAAQNNRYWAVGGVYPPFRPLDWSSWRSAVGESGSTFSTQSPADARISAYMQSINMSGGLAEFMAQARLQSRQNWRTQFTSEAVNDFVRARVGASPNP